MDQTIRFCTTDDGVRIAYATVGQGPPLVKAANWLNHLEFDWESPVWRHWLEELSRDHFANQNRPTPSASIRVRLKQSTACSGVCTIGSFSLNEVLSRTGMPVRRSKALMRS